MVRCPHLGEPALPPTTAAVGELFPAWQALARLTLQDPACYHTHLGQAVVFHGSCAFPVLQVIWPDPCGFFPWEASFDRRFAGMQRLLFDPSSLGQASADGGGEERQF